MVRKYILLFGVLLMVLNLSAQNYDSYLQAAYSALEEGKIEVAQSAYNIYKKITAKTDLDFETLLKDKIDNDWQKSCHIIDLGNGEYLAAQKPSSIQMTHSAAKELCEASRLGGFDDWRLPFENELDILFSEENFITSTSYYWLSFTTKSDIIVAGEIKGNIVGTGAKNIEGDHYMYHIIDYADNIRYKDSKYVNMELIESGYGPVTLPKHYYISIRKFKK